MELATPVLSISPLIMLLDNMWKLLPEVIFCTVAIFSGLIAWLLPETNNARLPETIEDIEEMRKKPTNFTTEDQICLVCDRKGLNKATATIFLVGVIDSTMILPGIAYLVNDWRPLVITVTAPLILAVITWRFRVAFTYYGNSLNISGFGLNLYLTQFIYGAIELPSKLVAYLCLDKLGRRYSQVGTLITTGVCISINVIIPRDLWLPRTVIFVQGKGFLEASFTCVFLYNTELYPTVLQQNGLSYSSFVGRVGVSLAPLVSLHRSCSALWVPVQVSLRCSSAMF
ncbi:hypothetical protein cypCar_00008073 [Cyprinus carpio]|nr:hypothetical protein cypCar_00008073 [Cyprinus carpio]